MLSPKNVLGIFLYVNVVSWLLLLIIKLISFLGFSGQDDFTFNFYLKGLLLNLFILIVFFYFSSRVENLKKIDFVEILTNLFILGLITNTLSLLVQFILSLLEIPPVSESKANLINIFYHVNIGLLLIFLTQAFFYWKKLVLYEKNSLLNKIWNVFEYLLLISLLFNFFEFDLRHLPFIIALGALLMVGLILSINLKWVAYLNAKEKWQSILLLLFIGIFSFYFFRTVISHSYTPYFSTELMHSVYVLAMFIFVIFYSVFSLLVIIFNLPTTSVFEKKIEEVTSFQKLAQSLQAGENENQVYEVLLESAINTVAADAAWLEVTDEKGNLLASLNRDIDKETVEQIKRLLKKNRLNKIINNTFSRDNHQNSLSEEMSQYDFESILIAPLIANEKSIGTLNLLKKVKDGFDEEKKELVNTFARQASISIENFRLLSRTIEAERYKEEIKIASSIQKRLLPSQLNLNENFEITAFSESAYEVGGDYYDTYKVDESKTIVIVGDVSGKGTTAAFHMAQLKGIFQSLAQLDLSSKDFLFYANKALINCLEKNSFITATIVLINTQNKKIEFARAGHCPTLYYDYKKNESIFFQGKGLGLGILRNQEFCNHIEIQYLDYSSGDMILLYTDGVVEAKNKQEEDYGYEKLALILKSHAHLRAEAILDEIIRDLNHFKRDAPVYDDHTALLIKFK